MRTQLQQLSPSLREKLFSIWHRAEKRPAIGLRDYKNKSEDLLLEMVNAVEEHLEERIEEKVLDLPLIQDLLNEGSLP